MSEFAAARCLNGTLLIEELDSTTASGLVTNLNDQQQRGRVAKVGDGDYIPGTSVRAEIGVGVGGVVLYVKQEHHVTVTLDGERYRLIHHTDIHMVLSD